MVPAERQTPRPPLILPSRADGRRHMRPVGPGVRRRGHGARRDPREIVVSFQRSPPAQMDRCRRCRGGRLPGASAVTRTERNVDPAPAPLTHQAGRWPPSLCGPRPGSRSLSFPRAHEAEHHGHGGRRAHLHHAPARPGNPWHMAQCPRALHSEAAARCRAAHGPACEATGLTRLVRNGWPDGAGRPPESRRKVG
jgi:hypothetical protein